MAESEKPESASDKIEDRKQTSKRQSKRRQSNRSQSNRRQSRRQSQRRQSRKSSRKSSRGSRNIESAKKLSTAEEVMSTLRTSAEFLESPIDLCRDSIETTNMNPLQWQNYYANPLFLKVTNTTNTVVLNGLFPTHFVPTLTGGPLLSSYKFVQLHFHWGEHNDTGSDHKIEGESYPLEAHVVLYNADYGSYDIARSMEDGIIILVYMFQTHNSSQIQEFTKHLPKLREPYSQIPLDTVSLMSFLPPVVDDYVLYFGYMAASCNHGILWLVSRNTLAVTQDELREFRRISSTASVPIGHNFREIRPTFDRAVLFVNPEKDMKQVLHPLPHSRAKTTTTVKSKGRRESRRGSKKSSRRQSRRASKRSSKVRTSKKK